VTAQTERAAPRRRRRRERTKPKGLEVSQAVLDLPEWSSYLRAISALEAANLQFMLGGGFAQGIFTGRWRNTKDIDFYIVPESRERAVKALEASGFADYYPTLAYDRRWIHRSIKNEVIVDIIWAMANQRAQVEPLWFERAGVVDIHGHQVRVLPIEEFAWCKLYILQRDRCDWIDVLNLIYENADRIDWEHLIQRLGPDTGLLGAILDVYGWLHPGKSHGVPPRVRRLLQSSRSKPKRVDWRERARLLDSRAWFSPLRPKGERLEV